MRLKTSFKILTLLISIISCENGNSKDDQLHDYIIKEVAALQEAELAQQSIDSFKKATGIPVEMTIDIVDSSIYENDSPNTVLAFINRSSPVEKRIMYIIKFDKRKKQIISVEKN